MKTLSLYIDRWYIVAAISSDNVSRCIELPNREDRIWLYFYEGINNDRIIYGKNCQKHYLDKEIHYYGDIFSKIVSDNEKFKHFGRNVGLREIFNASEIFAHLRKDFPDNEPITTYVSFSLDVMYASQKVFLDLLDNNGFKVKESVASISHLALELSLRKGLIENAKTLLVLLACNENLRYIIYKKSGDIFVRQAEEEVLFGYGTDLRGRALLEQIVGQLNKSLNFLKEEKEVEYEIARLSQNLERWLLQLDNAKQGYPVVYNDIAFSKTPNNKQNVTILKNEIENRTKVIVGAVVDEVVRYVKENEILSSDISHILFIGDSFKNTMFKDALLQRYAVDNDNIIIYQDKDLPEIVSIYNQMDLSQFDSLRTDIKNLSAEQLKQIEIGKKGEKTIQGTIKQPETEKKFNDALQEAKKYEKKGDYSSMIDFLHEALNIKPDNAEVKQLLDEATRKLSEGKINDFKTKIKEKEQLFDYKSAIDICWELLSIDIGNKEKWQSEYNRLQSLQKEKSDLELNYKRKKADIKHLIRSGKVDVALEQIKSIQAEYCRFGINSHDNDFEGFKLACQEKKTETVGKMKDNPKIIEKKHVVATNPKEKFQDNIANNKAKIDNSKAETKGVDSQGWEYLKKKNYVTAKRHFADNKNSKMAEICTELIKLEKARQNGTITSNESRQLNELYEKYNIN